MAITLHELIALAENACPEAFVDRQVRTFPEAAQPIREGFGDKRPLPGWKPVQSTHVGAPIASLNEEPVHDQMVEQGGFDALAWYVPFHTRDPRWGIYVRAHGLEVIISELISQGVPLELAGQMAFDVLLAHETAHAESELLVTGVELATRKPHYLDGFDRQRRLHGWSLAEEANCNLEARKALPKKYRTALDRLFAASPIGYRDWGRFNGVKRQIAFGAVVGDLVSGMEAAWFHAPTMNAQLREVPVYLVMDGGGQGGGVRGFDLDFIST